MAYIDQTIMASIQDSLAQDERKYNRTGIVDAAHKSTEFVDFVSPMLQEKLKTISSAQGFSVPVIKDGTAISVSTPGFDKTPDNRLETDTINWVAVDVFSGYKITESDFADNLLTVEQYAQVQTKRCLESMAIAKENAIKSILDARKTQTLGYLDVLNSHSEGAYSFVGGKLRANKAAIKDTFYYDLDTLMRNNKVSGGTLLVTSAGGDDAIMKTMLKNGAGQSVDKSWASKYMGMDNIFVSDSITPGVGNVFEGYLIEKGSVGIYENFPYDFAKGKELADRKWFVTPEKMPFVNQKLNVHISESAVDGRGKFDRGSNSVMTTEETVSLWARFYVVYKYNSDIANKVNPIVAIEATIV